MKFELITEKMLAIVLDIVNSNPAYNMLENGNPTRSMDDIKSDFLGSATESYIVTFDNRPVGIIDFLENNPNDHFPWVGLLMIHGDDHSLGYGKKMYVHFEDKLRKRGINHVRLGVLQENVSAKKFWQRRGFQFYGKRDWEGKVVECFEKSLK